VDYGIQKVIQQKKQTKTGFSLQLVQTECGAWALLLFYFGRLIGSKAYIFPSSAALSKEVKRRARQDYASFKRLLVTGHYTVPEELPDL